MTRLVELGPCSGNTIASAVPGILEHEARVLLPGLLRICRFTPVTTAASDLISLHSPSVASSACLRARLRRGMRSAGGPR